LGYHITSKPSDVFNLDAEQGLSFFRFSAFGLFSSSTGCSLIGFSHMFSSFSQWHMKSAEGNNFSVMDIRTNKGPMEEKCLFELTSGTD